MSAFQLLIAMVILAFPSGAWGEDAERGSIPPGSSRDGSAPSDGALKGGAILPGETGRMPDSRAERCKELSGTLREDCLRQAREAAASGSAKPSDIRMPEAERAD
jgi:hypothetical protein